MGVKDRGREERKEHEGGREAYEGAWEWRIEGGKRGKNMREEGRHEGAWEWMIEGGKRGKNMREEDETHEGAWE